MRKLDFLSEEKISERSGFKNKDLHFFGSFYVDFSREITKKALKWTKKAEKRLKKNVLTSFQVLQLPESWSKYTTNIYINSINEFNSNSEEDFRILMKRWLNWNVWGKSVILLEKLYILTSVWVQRTPNTGRNSHFQHFLC